MNSRIRFALVAAFLVLWWPVAEAREWDALRTRLTEEIRQDVLVTAQHTGRDRLDSRVLSAIGREPRHEFVPGNVREDAYENRPLPIGYGQTISQPYIVALMTDLLEPEDDHVVLEVGTGSGYQAAILARLVKHVYTMEIVEPLADRASATLDRLGYDNVTVRHGDGYFGWSDHAPYDGIIVTAAGSSIPPPLVEQLKPGGKMILPVGGRFTAQYLVLVTKAADGSTRTRQILPVRFVPLTGKH